VKRLVIDVSPLMHIEIVVPNADKAYEFLHKVFGAEKVEQNISKYLSRFPATKVIHVELGDVVLQFIEPLTDGTIWADFLKEKGPGVHNLNFHVKNVKEVAKVFKQEGLKTIFKLRLDWEEFINSEDLRPDIPPVYMLEAKDIVGFRFELQEIPFKEDKIPDGIKIKSHYDLQRD
jgi:catechol 2,3-dioxygenase-like lactoylglutathione lyase family enzyme